MTLSSLRWRWKIFSRVHVLIIIIASIAVADNSSNYDHFNPQSHAEESKVEAGIWSTFLHANTSFERNFNLQKNEKHIEDITSNISHILDKTDILISSGDESFSNNLLTTIKQRKRLERVKRQDFRLLTNFSVS